MERNSFGLVGLLLMPILLIAVGCGGGEQQGEQQRPETVTKEVAPKTVTQEVTKVVTVEETVAAPEVTAKRAEAGTMVEEEAATQEGSPEEALTLQYQYINSGDYESAYALFAQQSQQEVSVEQYRAFFEANAPYSLTEYSFPSVDVQGNAATVEAAFTANSASGQEQLQRTQQLVREGGQWRVVMRDEQVTAFAETPTENANVSSAVAGQSDGLQVGETADLGGVKVTVNEVYRTYGDEFDRQSLQPGEVYVVMNTTLLNEGDTTPYISTTNWTLYNQDGGRLPGSYISALQDTPEYSGDLRPGRQFSGPVPATASESDTLIAEYQPLETMTDSNNYATWEIGPVSELPEQGAAESQY